RLEASLLALFGTASLLLAAFGIYAVLSHSVVLREQELGVRMALGATRRDVLRLVLREGATLSSVGIVLGTAGALAATRLLKSWPFAAGRTAPLPFAAVAPGLVLIALVAPWVPARRATRVDPLIVMRGE